MTDCLFCKIINKTIPARIFYEDDDFIAFHDIKPVAPIHFLLIPKKHMEHLAAAPDDPMFLGTMMLLAKRLAHQQGLNGYKVGINVGAEGGQEIFHLHVHVYGTPNKNLTTEKE